MPTLFKVKGYRFFLYSNDHLPKHVHIEKGEGTAKFSLFPVELIKSKRFKVTEINEIRKLVAENRDRINEKWDEYFSHQ